MTIQRSLASRCWLLAFALFAPPGGLTAESVAGDVASLEGDRLMLRGAPIQIEALHCPSIGEPGGWVASQRIKRLFDSATVTCALTGRHGYAGEIGNCSVNGVDVAAHLIEVGACARCERHDPEDRYLNAERAVGNRAMWSPHYCQSR